MIGRIAFLCAIAALAVSAEHWSVKTAGGIYCLLVDANATGEVTHQVGNETKTFSFAINATTVDADKSNCFGPTINGTLPTNKLKVDFWPNGAVPAHSTESQLWSLEMVFVRTAEHDSFDLYDYTLTTAPTSGAYNETETFHKSDKADINFAAGGKNGFKCSSSALSLERDSTVTLTGVRAIAFAQLDKDEFPAEQAFEQCYLDSRTSDIVPIVVGACLAGLVVVVLIAYLIGRARARRQGYASV